MFSFLFLRLNFLKITFALVTFGLVLSSPALAQKEKTLQIGMNMEFESLNPLISSTAAAKYVLYFATRLAVYMDDKSEWQPMIYKNIPNLKDKSLKIVTEAGQKKLVATWELVDKLKWGDGVPVTCKDAKFTWEVGLNPNVSLPSRDGYQNIESVEWDEKTPTKCVIKYKSAKWNFFVDSHQQPIMPEHIEGPVYAKWGKEKEGYDRNTLYQKDPTIKGLWNGPYVVSEYKLGSHLVFVPNPHFYGAAPKIQKVVVRIIPNTGTLEANLRSKNVDKLARHGLSLDQALVFEKKVKDEKLPYQVIFQDGITYAHLDVNLDHPILKDIKVRQAISHAINKQDVNKSLFEGKVTIAHSAVSPLDPLYTEDPKLIKIYKTDKKLARKILDEAGWKLNSDGIRTKDGKKLSFSLVGAAGIKQVETLQAILQAQLRDVGIDLQIKSDPARLLFSETLNKRKFDLAIYSWSSFPGIGQESTLHSRNIPAEKNTWTGQNYPGFKSDSVDDLTVKYDYEFDPKKRKDITNKIMKEYTEQIPVIPLYFRSENAVIPTNMKNYKLTGHMFYETLFAEKWDLQ